MKLNLTDIIYHVKNYQPKGRYSIKKHERYVIKALEKEGLINPWGSARIQITIKYKLKSNLERSKKSVSNI